MGSLASTVGRRYLDRIRLMVEQWGLRGFVLILMNMLVYIQFFVDANIR